MYHVLVVHTIHKSIRRSPTLQSRLRLHSPGILSGTLIASSFGQTSAGVQAPTSTAVASDHSVLPGAPTPNAGGRVGSSKETSELDLQPADDELTMKELPLRFLSDEWHIVRPPASIRKDDLRWLMPHLPVPQLPHSPSTQR